ncbi:reverse transcriptase domain-containing protein [Tanacetum coccineum]
MIGVRSLKDKKRKAREATKKWMNAPITFPLVSTKDVSDEPLIVEAKVEEYLVRRIYVDGGASVEVKFEHCFENLSLEIKARLKETQTDLVGFARETTKPLGKIELEVCFGSEGLCQRTIMKFTVIRSPSPYNVILGRTNLKALRAIPSTIHSIMKFPTLSGIATLVTRSEIISECWRLEKKQVIEEEKEAGTKAINVTREKRRVLAPEKRKSMTRDVDKWVKAGIIRPIRYPTWIANPVLVKKCDGSWWMCIDFKNLNSACPKDFYPFPNIDCKVESMMGFKYKCFLDAYKGYHQIQMSKEDEEKTTFYTDQGTYYYTKMSFELKNARATYQHLVDSTLRSQIGRNLEAYIDGKFLGYMVTSEGIRANPKKTRVLVDLQSPRTLKEMQSLARKLTALNRFLANSKGDRSGLELIGPSGIEHTYAVRLTFDSINNEAEYEALLAGLRIAKQMNVQRLEARAKEYIAYFKSFSIKNIPRNQNQKADVLSKLALVALNHLTKEVLVEVLNERSTERKEISTIVMEEGDNWMTLIVQCLEKGIWAKDKNEARNLQVKINQYVMENGVLFKKSYLVPMLRYVGPLQVNYVIREIYIGSCGMHSGPQVVVKKSMRQGCYWPTMHEDAKKEIQKCDSCQIHSAVPKLLKTFMTSIMAPWPFYQWGMDILGPLPQASGRIKYVIVAIDYFTKWIEAKLLVKITGKDIIRFVLDSIICKFGLPRIIVTDNDTQFVNDPFKSWCARLNIQQMNTAVAHPQANGLVERANKSLIEGIKPRLGREKAGWVDELPNVLWAHRTSIKTSNEETPFSLTYKSKAVIPVEIGIPTYRTMMIKEGLNGEEIRLNLDLLTERRELVAIR